MGTTGILVSSALLMLAMVSALVAFRGWPGSTPGAGVQPISLPSSHAATYVSAPLSSSHRVVRALPAAKIAAAAAAIGRTTATAGLRKEVPASGPATVSVPPPMNPAPTRSGTGPAHSSGGPTPPPPTHDPSPPPPTAPPIGLPSIPPPDPNSTTSTVDGIIDGVVPPGLQMVVAALPGY